MAAPVFVPAKTDYPLTVYADPEAVLNRPLSAAPHAKAGRTPLSPSKNGLPAYAPANKGKEKEMTKTLKVPAPNPLAGEHGLGAGEFGFLLPAPSGLLMGRSSAKSDDRPKRPKRSKNTVDYKEKPPGIDDDVDWSELNVYRDADSRGFVQAWDEQPEASTSTVEDVYEPARKPVKQSKAAKKRTAQDQDEDDVDVTPPVKKGKRKRARKAASAPIHEPASSTADAHAHSHGESCDHSHSHSHSHFHSDGSSTTTNSAAKPSPSRSSSSDESEDVPAPSICGIFANLLRDTPHLALSRIHDACVSFRPVTIPELTVGGGYRGTGKGRGAGQGEVVVVDEGPSDDYFEDAAELFPDYGGVGDGGGDDRDDELQADLRDLAEEAQEEAEETMELEGEEDTWESIRAQVVQQCGRDSVKAAECLAALDSVRAGSKGPFVDLDTTNVPAVRRLIIDASERIWALDTSNATETARSQAAHPELFDSDGRRKLGFSSMTGSCDIINFNAWTTADDVKFDGGGRAGFGGGGALGRAHKTELIQRDRGLFVPGVESMNTVGAAFLVDQTGKGPHRNPTLLPPSHLSLFQKLHSDILALLLPEHPRVLVYNGKDAVNDFFTPARTTLGLKIDTFTFKSSVVRNEVRKSSVMSFALIRGATQPRSSASLVVTRDHQSALLHSSNTESKNLLADLIDSFIRATASTKINFPPLSPSYHYDTFKPKYPEAPDHPSQPRMRNICNLRAASAREQRLGAALDPDALALEFPGIFLYMESILMANEPAVVSSNIPEPIRGTKLQRAQAINTAKSKATRVRFQRLRATVEENKLRPKEDQLDVDPVILGDMIRSQERYANWKRWRASWTPAQVKLYTNLCCWGCGYATVWNVHPHEMICGERPEEAPTLPWHSCSWCTWSTQYPQKVADHEALCRARPDDAPDLSSAHSLKFCTHCPYYRSPSSTNLAQHEEVCNWNPATGKKIGELRCSSCGKDFTSRRWIKGHEEKHCRGPRADFQGGMS